MKVQTEITNTFTKYSEMVDREIMEYLRRQKNGRPYEKMFDMMAYYFGYLDKDFNSVKTYGGKKFRSGLCLLIADCYGVLDKVVKFATSIEVFHNFTLIHDDIEDNDPLRRGRESIWKLWGLNHGINTGDTQMMLAMKILTEAETELGDLGLSIQSYLIQRFIEIAEGQYLDFALTDVNIEDELVNEENYLEMITKKTSILVGASTESAGIAAGLGLAEQKALWEYGVNLGIAYQICDDLVSIWADSDFTGKIETNDIREKKKTLPIIYMYNSLSVEEKKVFEEIYNKKGDLTEDAITTIKKMLDSSDAYDYVWDKMSYYANLSLDAVEKLSLNRENKDKLISINKALLPDVREVCKC